MKKEDILKRLAESNDLDPEIIDELEEEEKEVLIHLAGLIQKKKEKEKEKEMLINPFLRKKIASIKKRKEERERKSFPIITTTHDILREEEGDLQRRLNKALADEKE